MTPEIMHNQSIFESIKKTTETNQNYWSARDLAKILEYIDYRNFKIVIDKAMEACKNSSQSVEDHFVDSNEMGGIIKKN